MWHDNHTTSHHIILKYLLEYPSCSRLLFFAVSTCIPLCMATLPFQWHAQLQLQLLLQQLLLLLLLLLLHCYYDLTVPVTRTTTTTATTTTTTITAAAATTLQLWPCRSSDTHNYNYSYYYNNYYYCCCCYYTAIMTLPFQWHAQLQLQLLLQQLLLLLLLLLHCYYDLAVPVTRTTRYGPRSFAVAGRSTWNSLPAPLRNCQLSSSFRHELKTELFARAYLH